MRSEDGRGGKMTREEAIKAIDHIMYSSPHESTEEVVKKKYYAEKLIDYIANTIEVVHCKECRWGRKTCGNVECRADLNVPPEYHGYDWFCPNGER